jgi:hypothetical protein
LVVKSNAARSSPHTVVAEGISALSSAELEETEKERHE